MLLSLTFNKLKLSNSGKEKILYLHTTAVDYHHESFFQAGSDSRRCQKTAQLRRQAGLKYLCLSEYGGQPHVFSGLQTRYHVRSYVDNERNS